MSKKEQPNETAARADAPAAASPPTARTVVSGLMEERRRFESWLAALDARRDTTPPRVFTRVHADYTTRLEAVVKQLTSHSEGLRAELASLTERLEAAHDEQQQVRDERAESELRAHVGELSVSEWEATARAADERIDALVTRHADLQAEMLRTRELLAEAQRPATPHLAADAIPSAKARDAAAEASVSASVAAAAATATPGSIEAVSDTAEGAAHVPSAGPEDAESAPSAAPAGAGESASPPTEISPALLDAQANLLEGPPAGAPPPRRTGAGSFDELAFLNSVVDTPAASADKPAEPPKRESVPVRTRDIGIENRDATADASILGRSLKKGTPMAANISGNNPIVLKDKPAESAKTLKCSDCGAMNYPTEWYCERCGAELASL
jgi:hypothetical protein